MGHALIGDILIGHLYLRRWNVLTGAIEYEFVLDEEGAERAGLRRSDPVDSEGEGAPQ